MNIQLRIILIPIIVMLLVGGISSIVLETFTESLLERRVETELTRLAQSAAEALNSNHNNNSITFYDDLADRLSNAGDARITYSDDQGILLGDSSLSLSQVKNSRLNNNLPEVQSALKEGYGAATHYSEHLKKDMRYIAVKQAHHFFTGDGIEQQRIIITRAALPLEVIHASVTELRSQLIPIGLGSFIAVVILGFIGAHNLNRTIRNDHETLEARVEMRTRKISILQTLGALLNTCSNIEEAGQVIEQVVPTLLPGTIGGVSLIKSSRNRLDLIASWGETWPGEPYFSPSECWSLRKGYQHNSNIHGMKIKCEHWSHDLDHDTVCMPLLAQGETVGALHLVLTNNDVNHDEELLNTVSEQIGLMLANIMLRSNLKDQAMRDHVTGLYNRRYMTESLEQSVSRAERNKDSIAVFMLDVDHFKRFNDNYGHDAGDHVLKVLAGILQRSVRKEDIVCRYGGEEFCIVCYNLQESGALQIARTIADRLSEQKLNLNQLTLGKITVSIGLSLMPVHANTVEGLLKSADEALYKAKNQGRDCVVVAGISKTLVSQPLEKTTEIQRPA